MGLAKNFHPDRSKIEIEDDDQIRFWTKHYDVTADTLRQAIEKVGNSAAAVRKELRRQKEKS